MQVTYYGHSCFLLETNEGVRLLFDPFITGNPIISDFDINTIKADYILQTHGHADHILDTVAIAQNTQAKVIGSWEIHEWLGKQGVTNTHPMNVGGKWTFDFGTVKCVVAQHSSGLPDGSYGGSPMGFLITTPHKNIYYAGDTGLTLDMQLIPTWAKIDTAFLPIGDNFTMDIHDAVTAANFVQCNHIIGMHFDTFGFIKINHQQAIETFASKGKQLILPTLFNTFTI